MAFPQAGDHGLRSLGLVVLVHGQQGRARFVDAVGAQHLLGVACVFTGNAIGKPQYMQGTQGDVGQVADGRGDNIQAALRIMLRTGRIFGGLDG